MAIRSEAKKDTSWRNFLERSETRACVSTIIAH